MAQQNNFLFAPFSPSVLRESGWKKNREINFKLCSYDKQAAFSVLIGSDFESKTKKAAGKRGAKLNVAIFLCCRCSGREKAEILFMDHKSLVEWSRFKQLGENF
jgi:hypothetical protein